MKNNGRHIHDKKNTRTNYKRRNVKDGRTEKKNEEKTYDDIIEGRNPVLELLESGKDINKIFIQSGEKNGSITKIIAKAREKRIVMVEVHKSKLDEMSETKNHQGVIAIVPPFEYCDVYDIIEYAKQKNEKAFILILDGIEDPHNLGSIIRTAETAGVHGIVIPKRRAVAVNATVAKTSAGAIEHVKIARVSNLNETIKYLKENGIWIYGTDGEAKLKYYNQDFRDSIALVIGSEGNGMSELVKKNCDGLVTIPMKGKINSLNASVSAGIIMYEVVKQRLK
jgi:23S rRNA (guanosine2251-2'-O)-methyltransferase